MWCSARWIDERLVCASSAPFGWDLPERAGGMPQQEGFAIVKATGHYAEVKDVVTLIALEASTREHIDHWIAKFPPERKLGVGLGESTPDGRIYPNQEEECRAACCGAPMMVVNGHYHEKLTTDKVDDILDELK